MTAMRDRPEVEPTATEEEAAAIVAALEALWPRPTAPTRAPADVAPKWRFSGRSWSRPVPARRVRPW